jgi:hypothetical protein
MNFKEATENLCSGVSHEELAAALGVSVATIRQARLRPDAKAHRSPPANWERAIIELAQRRMQQFRHLIDTVRQSPPS